MTAAESLNTFCDHFHYHGLVEVEQVRCHGGEVLWRHWHLFDSVEAAQDFYFSQDAGDGVKGAA